MEPALIAVTAQDAFEDYGAFTVSVEAVIDSTVDETCRTSPRIGERYGKIRVSTFGRLRSAGFAVIGTFGHPHFDVLLPDTTERTIARLVACFDDPIPNPARAGQG